MGNFVFNRAKGRGTEWMERINANDPANSVLLVALIASAGVQADAVLLDLDDWSALVAGTTDFATNTGATRKSLDQTSGITITYDDGLDRVDVDIPDQTWTAVANDGTGAISDLTTGYDSDSTAGTDANVLPFTWHDFVITPDGSDITAQVNVFYRAS
ncbi:MAG: hypothetical protein KGJ86_13240 [Chloroflexota bacterium]|nr:hypothetical protein [Chloroflexota bacterium]